MDDDDKDHDEELTRLVSAELEEQRRADIGKRIRAGKMIRNMFRKAR